MTKKNVLSMLCYTLFTALLCLAEKVSGIKGIALAFCIALVFCKENLISAILPYAVCSALLHFDLWYCICVASGVLCVLFLALIHYKANKKYRLWANLVAITVSHIPIFILYYTDIKSIVIMSVGVILSLIFHYVCVVSFYPVTVRGLKYRLSPKELSCVAIFVIPLGAGLNSFDIYGVKLFFFGLILCLLFLSALDANKILGLAIASSIGASLVSGSPFEACCAVILGGTICILRNVNKYVCGGGTLLVYCATAWFFKTGISLFDIIPVVVACLSVFVPDKAFNKLKGYRQSYQGKFALRTMLNRDRAEVSKKLKSISSAFRRMETLLESEQVAEIGADDIVGRICEVCCRNCGKFAVCREKIGDMRVPLKKLALRGLENGRVSVLDADALGAVCIKLPKIVNMTNECIRDLIYKKERRSGIEQGREMVVSNLDGTADLLDELAASVSTGFGFDVDMEKKIIEELGYANIIAGDVAIYGDSEKINLSVRECDAKKPELRRVLSEVTGTGMREAERERGVNGTVNLVFCPNPNYGVLYGEKSESKENVCGDTRQAVRIANDKLMFILSDGMGTGNEARFTGLNTIALIETFYKAGFTHKTIFSCVSKLLALRTKESFSALDVAIMDTKTGEIDFIKQGGRESYLFSKNGVEVIEGGSLPLGIIEGGEPRIERRRLIENDLVILISDGVADRLNSADMTEILSGLNTLNPQVISDKIVENAKNKTDGHVDDMTAMALRVVRNTCA